VMYLGQIVEAGPTEAIFANPRHPYTMALLSSIPGERLLEDHQRIVLEGEIPSPLDPPSGCRFHTRCPFAVEACRRNAQILHELAPGHAVACERAQAGEIPTFWLKQQRASQILRRIGDAEEYLAARRARVTGEPRETVERTISVENAPAE